MIHVIQFDTGEYSDRTERIVAAYIDKEAAERHLGRLNDWLRERALGDDNEVASYEDRQNLYCPFDPELDDVDYTGARYTLFAVPLMGAGRLAMMSGYDNRPIEFADWLRENGWDEQTAARWQLYLSGTTNPR